MISFMYLGQQYKDLFVLLQENLTRDEFLSREQKAKPSVRRNQ